jgi:hypothetical protein
MFDTLAGWVQSQLPAFKKLHVPLHALPAVPSWQSHVSPCVSPLASAM